MDALAGYGSESTSSENQEISSNQKSSLIGLLGSPLSGTDDDDQVEAPCNPPKRQRLQDAGRNEMFEQTIPSPPTTTTCGASIAHLDEDYLSPMLKSLRDDETSIANRSYLNSTVAQKLRSANDSIPGQTLAQNARSQSDYYNPRFFQIVRDRFGIEKPLQSRAKHASGGLKQYEKQLFQTGHVDGVEH